MLCLQNLLLWHVRMVGKEKATGAMYAKLIIMVRQNDQKKTFLIRERFVIKAIRQRYFTKRRGGGDEGGYKGKQCKARGEDKDHTCVCEVWL